MDKWHLQQIEEQKTSMEKTFYGAGMAQQAKTRSRERAGES